MRISHLLIYVFLRAGLFLLGDMVWQVSMTDLLASIRIMGWWMVLWILLEIVPVLLHMADWAVCFQKTLWADIWAYGALRKPRLEWLRTPGLCLVHADMVWSPTCSAHGQLVDTSTADTVLILR